MDYTKAERILKLFNLDKVGPGWHFTAPYMCGDRLTIQFHDDFWWLEVFNHQYVHLNSFKIVDDGFGVDSVLMNKLCFVLSDYITKLPGHWYLNIRGES